MTKKFFLYNGFKYEGKIIKEDDSTITILDNLKNKEIKIYKCWIIAESEEWREYKEVILGNIYSVNLLM